MDELAPDGSPVAFYRALPERGEVARIEPYLPPRSAILELGCGAGRLTAVLLAQGHRVTAVDASAAMIAAARERARGAEYLVGRIEDLHLGVRYPVVLLASHLINDPDARGRVLACAAQHLAADGRLVAETYPPGVDWAAQVGRMQSVGPTRSVLTRASVADGRLEAAVRYEIGGRSWEQPFVADLLDEPALRGCLAEAGLGFEGWIDQATGWFTAVGTPAAGPAPPRPA